MRVVWALAAFLACASASGCLVALATPSKTTNETTVMMFDVDQLTESHVSTMVTDFNPYISAYQFTNNGNQLVAMGVEDGMLYTNTFSVSTGKQESKVTIGPTVMPAAGYFIGELFVLPGEVWCVYVSLYPGYNPMRSSLFCNSTGTFAQVWELREGLLATVQPVPKQNATWVAIAAFNESMSSMPNYEMPPTVTVLDVSTQAIISCVTVHGFQFNPYMRGNTFFVTDPESGAAQFGQLVFEYSSSSNSGAYATNSGQSASGGSSGVSTHGSSGGGGAGAGSNSVGAWATEGRRPSPGPMQTTNLFEIFSIPSIYASGDATLLTSITLANVPSYASMTIDPQYGPICSVLVPAATGKDQYIYQYNTSNSTLATYGPFRGPGGEVQDLYCPFHN